MSAPSPGPVTVRLTTADHVVDVVLEDSAATRALVDLLPVDLDVRDFHGIEKVADLPRRLPTDDAPAGYQAAAGDLTYYAPWGNLALFHRPFEHASGLVPLGRVVTDHAVLGDLEGPARLVLVETPGS
ncbi:hypothetical protein KC207_16150 [Phycicoccus sp. BSK3Z-2]|uniref:Cyclophilin-like domain-containing protein n=1 Tax=Phycicoccus avicenniae TaxID=2828860 RepID=A0A941I2A4_9MICO|nr:cyclophilin-like fold protein [Phycicoccus avicenniae]MBR7744829.1 hypothetical protein [Phycicoccus avicenniae]